MGQRNDFSGDIEAMPYKGYYREIESVSRYCLQTTKHTELSSLGRCSCCLFISCSWVMDPWRILEAFWTVMLRNKKEMLRSGLGTTVGNYIEENISKGLSGHGSNEHDWSKCIV